VLAGFIYSPELQSNGCSDGVSSSDVRAASKGCPQDEQSLSSGLSHGQTHALKSKTGRLMDIASRGCPRGIFVYEETSATYQRFVYFTLNTA